VVAEVVAGLVASGVAAVGVLLWRNRLHLAVTGFRLLSRTTVRVSMSALLRVKEDDRYVLFHSSYRPGSYGPPGGVVKAFPEAWRFLDRIGFREHRHQERADVMRADLRGFLRGAELGAFLRWYGRNVDRESARECLRRELTEELREIGEEFLAPLAEKASFTHVRTVLERPAKVPGQAYRQVRRFEVYDLDRADELSRWLRRGLMLAASRSGPGLLAATSDEIISGRRGPSLIAPQSAFLFERRRYRQDIPAVAS
jgi:hypothetical protein